MHKDMEQWFFKITEYADRLIDDLNTVDWPEATKQQQRNWIGRSEGARVKFEVKNEKNNQRIDLDVYTTRPDTLFGATFMVIAPEHSLLTKVIEYITNSEEVSEYISASKNKTDLERTDLNKNKTGIEVLGIKAINPVNNKEIPVFVADYVLMNYGTGAIMAVPAHDQRDNDFAKKYDLPIIDVVEAN
ncbi:MAG: class I tRNA ligase family protein, partial [Ignavibacteriae bacterium]|nr:class I tRNA ligase family protein [Ignavibacteriota bacterium]